MMRSMISSGPENTGMKSDLKITIFEQATAMAPGPSLRALDSYETTNLNFMNSCDTKKIKIRDGKNKYGRYIKFTDGCRG
jgi:hypothetical protein